MTPTSTSEISDPAEESLVDLSVLDFLYHDARRIGSFLSQFESDGHLQQMTRTKNGSKGKKESGTHEVKGSVGVASGNYKGVTETAFEMNEGYARVFDPYWANARAFLDHLSERDMIQRDVVAAEIGQFVLARGWVSILDLAMFKEAWKLPAIQRKAREGAGLNKPVGNQSASEKAAQKLLRENTELMLELMPIMPHSIYASMITPGENPKMLWGTLREEYLVTPPSDIMLSHGSAMPGEWSMLGILSAKPEFTTAQVEIEPQTVLGLIQSAVGQISHSLAPLVRIALGRPAAAAAITPLLIFREVQ